MQQPPPPPPQLGLDAARQVFVFDVEIKKVPDMRLGVDVMVENNSSTNRRGFQIEKVHEDGLVEAWNRHHEPPYRVEVHDTVERVNNVTCSDGSESCFKEMQMELQSKNELTLRIVRILNRDRTQASALTRARQMQQQQPLPPQQQYDYEADPGRGGLGVPPSAPGLGAMGGQLPMPHQGRVFGNDPRDNAMVGMGRGSPGGMPPGLGGGGGLPPGLSGQEGGQRGPPPSAFQTSMSGGLGNFAPPAPPGMPLSLTGGGGGGTGMGLGGNAPRPGGTPASHMSSSWPPPYTFKVTIDKSDGLRLGIDVLPTSVETRDQRDPQGFAVRRISVGDAVDRMNKSTNNPEKQILLEDVIVSVNGTVGPCRSMMEILKNANTLEIEIWRPSLSQSASNAQSGQQQQAQQQQAQQQQQQHQLALPQSPHGGNWNQPVGPRSPPNPAALRSAYGGSQQQMMNMPQPGGMPPPADLRPRFDPNAPPDHGLPGQPAGMQQRSGLMGPGAPPPPGLVGDSWQGGYQEAGKGGAPKGLRASIPSPGSMPPPGLGAGRPGGGMQQQWDMHQAQMNRPSPDAIPGSALRMQAQQVQQQVPQAKPRPDPRDMQVPAMVTSTSLAAGPPPALKAPGPPPGPPPSSGGGPGQPATFTFDVLLDKNLSSTKRLGIDAIMEPHLSSPKGFKVGKVEENGFVAEWNKRNEPPYQVQRGDVIVTVNGAGTYEGMVQEMVQASQITLHIERVISQGQVPPPPPPPPPGGLLAEQIGASAAKAASQGRMPSPDNPPFPQLGQQPGMSPLGAKPQPKPGMKAPMPAPQPAQLPGRPAGLGAGAKGMPAGMPNFAQPAQALPTFTPNFQGASPGDVPSTTLGGRAPAGMSPAKPPAPGGGLMPNVRPNFGEPPSAPPQPSSKLFGGGSEDPASHLFGGDMPPAPEPEDLPALPQPSRDLLQDQLAPQLMKAVVNALAAGSVAQEQQPAAPDAPPAGMPAGMTKLLKAPPSAPAPEAPAEAPPGPKMPHVQAPKSSPKAGDASGPPATSLFSGNFGDIPPPPSMPPPMPSAGAFGQGEETTKAEAEEEVEAKKEERTESKGQEQPQPEEAPEASPKSSGAAVSPNSSARPAGMPPEPSAPPPLPPTPTIEKVEKAVPIADAPAPAAAKPEALEVTEESRAKVAEEVSEQILKLIEKETGVKKEPDSVSVDATVLAKTLELDDGELRKVLTKALLSRPKPQSFCKKFFDM
eukprot:TRINITY_DN46742_c0_g2_i1.p1 TRINITY_DN46742_c0_g2~~TRINITY_DN46742_c0_g2_i1.p1  ORF type:complete len:1224 (+),score=352.90 TRINITY_DN46742_c0_g2_i1:83-3754(+)